MEEVVLAGNTLRGKPRANQVVGRDGYLGVAASSVRVHPVRWIGHISMQVKHCQPLPVGFKPSIHAQVAVCEPVVCRDWQVVLSRRN